MKKIFLLSLCFIGAKSYSQQATPARGLAINPVTVSFNLLPGQTETGKIYIANQMGSKKQFSVYLNDWRRDTVGAHNYTEPGKDARSCAGWVTPDKTFFELEAGQSTEISIRMNIPDSPSTAAQMKWCMLFIETVEEQKAEQGNGVTTNINNRFRFGVHVYQTPPVINRKEVRLLSLDALAGNPLKYRIVCQNSGEVQASCMSYIELSNLADGKRYKLPAQEFPLFPEQKRYVDFQVPDTLPKGKYSLTGVIDAGVDVPLEAAQLIIEIN